MATRKTTTARKSPRKKTSTRSGSTLARLERELPASLGSFRRRVRKGLDQLERDIERAQARTRRRGARLLREASHRLGHLEAMGEKQWRRLNTRARRDALSVLKRLERAVAGTGRTAGTGKKKAAKKKTGGSRPATRKKTAVRRPTGTGGRSRRRS